MEKGLDSQILSGPYAVSPNAPALSRTQTGLAFLAFEAHGLRIGLEITICFICYLCFSLLLPWQAWGVSVKWIALASWFLACGVVGFFDQLVLFRPVQNYRNAHRFELVGLYDRALILLESIGPKSKGFVRCPEKMYYLRRAEIFSHKEQYEDAERELNYALRAGLAKDLYHHAKLDIARNKGDFSTALEEVSALEKQTNETSLSCLEHGMTLFADGKSGWEAKRAFEKALTFPDMLHPSGEGVHAISQTFIECARLNIGYAEEALPELSRWVERFRQTAWYLESLRPLAAQILLIRARYLVSHKEPAQAVKDVQQALEFCCYPPIRKQAELVAEELSWRYQIETPVNKPESAGISYFIRYNQTCTGDNMYKEGEISDSTIPSYKY